MEELEERIAHLERANDDLSAEVARQARLVERLERRVGMLMEREVEREAAGQMPPADRPPPHY
ncbi:SlyX family protein [Pseudoroseicyclus tamaricis]|uniref:SlyX family protein n=1 Tax=Pseudoroseicyclus tamaricis TaxID=2705421 RepID=A0A6B2K2Z0_9RHOB|nr:SlyX family protein [Pseudoroseicyclus tamaricis]NDV02162.1 SlyX family protein [Pseudoroseicyclus tamaricis]